MRILLASLLLAAACVGPGRGAPGHTRNATIRATPSLAPAASNSDADREELVESFDSMREADNAHREAARESNAPPLAPLPQQ